MAMQFFPPWRERSPEPSPARRKNDRRSAERQGDDLPIGSGRRLLEQLPAPVFLVDESGVVLLANDSADRLLEKPMSGKRLATALRAPDLTEAIAEALKGHERDVDFSLHAPREKHFHARVRRFDDPGAEKRASGRLAIVLLEDRTRQRRAEQLHIDFVANASHELKTPLASLSGYIETLQGHAKNDPEARTRFLGIMAQQAARMTRLVQDLLSLSRIELNEHMAPRETINLADILQEVESAIRPIADEAGVAVIFETTGAPLIYGARDELAQVFLNLVDNAVKYGASEKPVRVTLAGTRTGSPGHVGISVIDHGPGVPREHLQRLTERFYRVSAASSRAKGGTGLGLAIAKHIISRHRGELQMESSPGAGCRFTVWLPVAA